MAVKDKTEDPKSKKDLDQEVKEIEDRKRDVTNAVLSSLDLSTEEPKKKEPEEPKEPEKKEPEEEITEEELKKIPDEDLTEEGLELKKELLEKEGGEELIPKSKVEKRFKALTEKLRKLEAELGKKPEGAPDPDMARLEGKSMEQLTTIRQNIRRELREDNRKIAAGEEVDEKRLNDLDILSDKVDEAIRTLPMRFQQKQIELYNKTADEITTDLQADISGDELEKACVEIKEIAQGIYVDYPKLQQSEEGQALALRLASDHWKARKEFSVDKSKVGDLRRSHKKLLRKTTLDRNILKADKGRKRLDELRAKAGRGGTDEDRKTFVREHPMFDIDSLIPEEFKPKK